MDNVSFFPDGKVVRHKANHSPPPTAKVMKVWSYTSISPHAIMARTGTSLPLPLNKKVQDKLHMSLLLW
jgi:hypothetical protein